jgi:hypothetical protein
VRTDLQLEAQVYALEVISGGFALMEPWLHGELPLSLTEKVESLGHVLRVTLEPDQPPDPAVLAEVAPRCVEIYERFMASYDPLAAPAPDS